MSQLNEAKQRPNLVLAAMLASMEPQNAPKATERRAKAVPAARLAAYFAQKRVRMDLCVRQTTKDWLMATAGGKRKVGRYLDALAEAATAANNATVQQAMEAGR